MGKEDRDMKITSVEVFWVNPPRGESRPRRNTPGSYSPVVAKVNTDEGVSGYGEAIAYGVGGAAVFGIVQDLAETVIGSDPFDTERIWENMRGDWVLTGGPITYSGVSAIDVALWDIKGKALGLPVYKLLGGKNREKIKVYISHIEFGWPDTETPLVTPDDYFKSAKAASDAGYKIVKANFLRYDNEGRWSDGALYDNFIDRNFLGLVADRIAAVQDALGPEGEIILENNAATTVEGAIQTAEAARNSNVLFFEEPISPDHPDNMKLVADRTGMAIATGERMSARWAFMPYLRNESIRVVQPDIGNTGGLTEAKKIADLAHIFGVQVAAHVCGGPLAEAAALQFEAAIPNFLLHEHHANSFIPENRKFGKYIYEAQGEYLPIPELPGIGQEMSEYAAEKSTRVLIK
jgi:L-alanine-DL-glutamate epimerase-like enolase superfamily enzyme